MRYVIGVDVGTGSVRAGVYDTQGIQHGYAVKDIAMHVPQPGWAEQSSHDIWCAVGSCVKAALKGAGLTGKDIVGIGFDATCSLVLSDSDGAELPIGDTSDHDVILWLDHRSQADADAINATNDPMLRSVGGIMSPEMQLPKLRWLKHNRPKTWAALGRAFDLTDWLTWKASGDDRRSLCTTVCKWGFDTEAAGNGPLGRWPEGFFDKIDLADLLAENAQTIGSEIVSPATPLGAGLTDEAASSLGLIAGTSVAAGLIDAHAGAAGIWMSLDDGSPLAGRLALIAGTSSCHMVLAESSIETPGVWGPYDGAVLPDLHLAEGGQSAAGAFLERLIAGHPAARLLPGDWSERYSTLDRIVAEQITNKGLQATLGPRVIVPDFAGNRSPLARADLTGLMAGITLDDTLEDLASYYLAGLMALANSSRQIVEALTDAGHQITSIAATGSGAQNRLLMQLHADTLQLPVVVSKHSDGVVLGAAMTATVAAGLQPDLRSAMAAMCRKGDVMWPNERQSASTNSSTTHILYCKKQA